MDYLLIRSARKTVALRVLPDGSLEVRAPLRMPKTDIDRFVLSKTAWIGRVRNRLAAVHTAAGNPYTADDLRRMAGALKRKLPPLLDRYAALLGVDYGRVTVRNQKTRWGSCSSKGNLNFNCLLAEAPEAVLDYVVAHELCHRLEMNHSKDFWSLVERVCPTYKESVRWLKEEGGKLQSRVPR